MSDMDPLWLMVDGVAAQVDGGDDAEKLAALEVVKRRLKAAGLGVLTLVCIRSDRPICNRSTVLGKVDFAMQPITAKIISRSVRRK